MFLLLEFNRYHCQGVLYCSQTFMVRLGVLALLWVTAPGNSLRGSTSTHINVVRCALDE